ncbi:hypothetical protein ACET3X_008734 [Alternaria dauci]|uniref:Uncharacterized protein n=1 Tax=Alternaria dauci TaxID=48095 RepID=A0ABR3UC46_9PLEO
MPATWVSDEDEPYTSPSQKASFSSSPNDNNDSLASSPPPLHSPFSPSPHKKGQAPSGIPRPNTFSSTYKAPPHFPANDANPLASPETTPTPPPRSAKRSELTSARIAAYEARTTEAATRAATGPIVPNPDKAKGLSSASQLPIPLYKAGTLRTPGQPSAPVNKLDDSNKPHTTHHASLSAQPTSEFDQPTREGGKGRRSPSVSSELSPFADSYVSATDELSELLDHETVEADRRQQEQAAFRPSVERSRTVLDDLEEQITRRDDNEHAIGDEEEYDWGSGDEEEEEPRLQPLSHYLIGGENFLTPPPVVASSSNQGNVRMPDSVYSSASPLDLSVAQWWEDVRTFWDGTSAGINETGDEILAGNDPRFTRVKPDRSKSAIPPKGRHSEPAEFSERKPGRYTVIQSSLSGYPRYEVSNVFFESIDQTKHMNEEAARRATCIDDPDAEPNPSTCPVYENLKVPLHERLSKMLPSPSNFSPPLGPDPFVAWTYEYRPRDHSLQVIEAASTTPALVLKDDALKARAEQYRENKAVLQAALKEVSVLTPAPDTDHAHECPHCHSVEASGSIPQGPRYQADVDTLQFLILAQHELRKDLARLEATQRGVQGSLSTLGIFPSRHRFGNAAQRQALVERRGREGSERQRQALEYQESREGTSGAELYPLDQELHDALSALDLITEPPTDPFRTISATANLAFRESLPFVNQADPRPAAPRRSSSEYSDRPTRSKSRATTARPVRDEPGMVDVGNPPKHPRTSAQDRAAAYQIMQSVQTYHNSGRTSRASGGSGLVDGESARIGRTRERGRPEDVVATSPSRDEERYPRRQNIIQQ